MSVIDKEKVYYIAGLAKLAINEDEQTQVAEHLSQILSLVQQIQTVDTSNVEPLFHPLEQNQILRQDTVTEVNQRELLQNNAPLTESGLYLVPKVIE